MFMQSYAAVLDMFEFSGINLLDITTEKFEKIGD